MINKLVEKRKQENKTQAEVACIIEKKTTTYAKKERGEIPITVEEAIKICDFLNCNLDIFLN